MTPEQIKELAIEVGGEYYSPPPMRAVRGISLNFLALEVFAKLIEAHTRAECARVCRNLIANEGTSDSIKAAKEVAGLCAEAIEGMK